MRVAVFKKIIWGLVVVVAFAGMNAQLLQAEESDAFTQQRLTSQLLVGLLLEKVDEGGLVIFERTLRREDLQAEKVAYVHNLADDAISISVTFQLRQPIPVPNYDNFFAHRICVDVDTDGTIKQVATHISCQALTDTPAESDKPGGGGKE